MRALARPDAPLARQERAPRPPRARPPGPSQRAVSIPRSRARPPGPRQRAVCPSLGAVACPRSLPSRPLLSPAVRALGRQCRRQQAGAARMSMRHRLRWSRSSLQVRGACSFMRQPPPEGDIARRGQAPARARRGEAPAKARRGEATETARRGEPPGRAAEGALAPEPPRGAAGEGCRGGAGAGAAEGSRRRGPRRGSGGDPPRQPGSVSARGSRTRPSASSGQNGLWAISQRRPSGSSM
jgi:hypothetical protein